MKKVLRIITLIIASLSLAQLASAQTKSVTKTISTGALTEGFVVPSGKTITIAAGATIANSGTATGFSVSDGDKGDVVVSSTGTVFSLDSDVVTTAARTLLDDANITAIRATLELTKGDSANNVPYFATAPLTTSHIIGAASSGGSISRITIGSGLTLDTNTITVDASTGGNEAADSGKAAKFGAAGQLQASGASGSPAVTAVLDAASAVYGFSVDHTAGSQVGFSSTAVRSGGYAFLGAEHSTGTGLLVLGQNAAAEDTFSVALSDGTTILGGAAGGTAELILREASGNGTNYIGLKAPASIAANKVWTMPAADGASGQAIVTDGSGVLSWADLVSAHNTQTASYTLALTDAGDVVLMSVGSANNLTVPPNADVAFPVKTEIVIVNHGSGQTTIVAGSGVTLRSAGGKLKLTSQWSTCALLKIGTNEWVVAGDLSL